MRVDIILRANGDDSDAVAYYRVTLPDEAARALFEAARDLAMEASVGISEGTPLGALGRR